MSTDRPPRVGVEKVAETTESAVGQPAPLSENLDHPEGFEPLSESDSRYSETGRGVASTRPSGPVGGWLSRFSSVARELAADLDFVGELERETEIDEESALAFQDPLLELRPDQPLGRDAAERDLKVQKLIGYMRQS